MYSTRISDFGNNFQGRLAPEFLHAALEYIEHNEGGLAFETLCDYICEYDIAISEAEYKEAIQLGLDLGCDLKSGRFKYLATLKKGGD